MFTDDDDDNYGDGGDNDDDVYNNRTWENIREEMKASATESSGYCHLK
jgi:hypothetical protein